MYRQFHLWITAHLLLVSPALLAASQIEQAIQAYDLQQYEQAFGRFETLASENDAEAQYYLGGMLVEGIGVPVNTKRGVYWLQRAVNNQHHLAARMLGNMYLSGNGVPMDPQKGAEYIIMYEKQAPVEEVDSGCE